MTQEAREYWLGRTYEQQKTKLQNLSVKVPQYQAVLGLTNAEVAGIQALVLEFISIQNDVYNCSRSMKTTNDWRNSVLYGPATGKDCAVPPQFVQIPTPTVTTGIVAQIKAFRSKCMANLNFTTEIGEDMGLLGAEIAPRPPASITPDFKVTAGQNYTVTLTGSMQGFGVARVEYCRNGEDYLPAGIIMNSGGSVGIPHPGDNRPESIYVRVVFVKKGSDYGNYSPSYSVIIS